MLEIIHRKKRLSSFKLIALGFAGVIVLGALILIHHFMRHCSLQPPLFALRGLLCRIQAAIGPLSGRR